MVILNIEKINELKTYVKEFNSMTWEKFKEDRIEDELYDNYIEVYIDNFKIEVVKDKKGMAKVMHVYVVDYSFAPEYEEILELLV